MADLPQEAIVGLMLNAEALEAADDLRHATLLGAMFAGQEGKQYLESLADTAWAEEPETAAEAKKSIAAGLSKKHG